MQLPPSITLIAAMDRHRAIGRAGQLPWHLPDDLKHFKQMTLGKTILMGRKTAKSLGRALPNRRNLVLTRSGDVPFSDMEKVTSLAEACGLVDDELLVIGGGEVYQFCLPLANSMHLTLIDCEVEDADIFFPEFDGNQWHEVSRISHIRDARHSCAFEFVDLQRI